MTPLLRDSDDPRHASVNALPCRLCGDGPVADGCGASECPTDQYNVSYLAMSTALREIVAMPAQDFTDAREMQRLAREALDA